MSPIPQDVVQICKKKLLDTKMELLNRVRENRKNFATYEETSGDEGDQSVRITQETEALSTQERLHSILTEIEFALARIENGTYGVCEETEEPIETERLLTIPWTRLSIEGAEVRESLDRRYAKQS